MPDPLENSRTPTILIVENELVLAHDLEDILRQRGYDVVGSASSGEEAIKLAQAGKPDLLLVDIKLKGELDGIDTAQRIKEDCDCAIVYITALTEPDLFHKAKETQPYGYLTKPVAPNELLRTLEMALYKHDMEKRLIERKEHFKELTDLLPEIVFEVDEKGMITFANKSAFDITGYSKEDLEEGFFSLNLISPKDRMRALENFHKAIKGNPFESSEYGAQRKDGSLFPVLVRSTPIVSRGEIVGLRGIIVDMTEQKRRYQALRESEEKFRTIFEGASDGMFGVDRHTRKALVASPSMCALTGYDSEEILELRVDDLHPQSDLPFVLEQFHKLLDRKIEIARDIPVLRKDGAIVYCDISTGFARFGGKEMFFGFFRNVTDRRIIETELRAERKSFQAIGENSPFGMLLIAADGAFQYINPKFVKMFGYEPSELPTGREWFRRAFPDPTYRNQVISAWLKDLEKSGPGEQRPRVYTVTCKDGTEKRIHFRPIQLESGENLMTCEDITHRKKQQEALQESEQMFRLLSEQSLMSVAILQDGIYKYANQAMAELCEYSVEEILNWKPEQFLELVHPEDKNLVMEQARMKQAGDPRQKTNYEFRIRTKSGANKWVEIYSKTVQFKGRSANLLTMIDISGRKEIEEQLRQSHKMEAIGTLAGGIAHDVNNLLQVILGQAEMLLYQQRVDEKGAASVEAIRRAAHNGADLVKRVLMFSRKAEADMRPVNLSDEVRRVRELLRRTIPRMISIELSLENDVRIINADSSQLEQIMLNLAVNASDAMPEGGRLVFETRNVNVSEKYSRLHPEISQGMYVLLTVSDTGHGIDRSISDRIFEPFFTTKQPGDGTGLGLSTVFGIVKAHGGHIYCDSEKGAGAIFKIFFPVINTAPITTHKDMVEMPAGGTETLLLVDDDDDVRILGAEMLELAGYTVLTASNGIDALQLYRQNKNQIGLVILDFVMPEMSGRQCLDELLKIDPEARILIASGYSANGPTKEALESGAMGLINKPFDLKRILVAVRNCLDSVHKKP